MTNKSTNSPDATQKSSRLSNLKGLLNREELKKVVGGYWVCDCVWGPTWPAFNCPVCCTYVGKFC